MFGIVVDTTSSWSLEKLQSLGIGVVPLSINFGGTESLKDAVELPPATFYEKMAAMSSSQPTTNCPTLDAVRAAYDAQIAAGADSVLCITISKNLSATFESAKVAAERCSYPVEAVNSRSTIQIITFMLMKAVALRDAGASLAEAKEAMLKIRDAADLFISVDTMENLVKGGRAGKALGLAAKALSIKPVLTTTHDEGIVDTVAKARGAKGALRQMADAVEAYVQANGESEILLSHGAGEARAQMFLEAIQAKGIEVNPEIGWVGPTIGTHVGANTVAVACCPKSLL